MKKIAGPSKAAWKARGSSAASRGPGAAAHDPLYPCVTYEIHVKN